MSVHVSSWAWKQDVGDAGAKLVLLKLADNANDQGVAWPAQKRIARECGMGRATVQRKLSKLIELGMIRPLEGSGKDAGATVRYLVGEAARVHQIEAPTYPQDEAPPASPGEAPPASRVRHQRTVIESTGSRQTADPDFNIARAARAELERLTGGARAS